MPATSSISSTTLTYSEIDAALIDESFYKNRPRLLNTLEILSNRHLNKDCKLCFFSFVQCLVKLFYDSVHPTAFGQIELSKYTQKAQLLFISLKKTFYHCSKFHVPTDWRILCPTCFSTCVDLIVKFCSQLARNWHPQNNFLVQTSALLNHSTNQWHNCDCSEKPKLFSFKRRIIDNWLHKDEQPPRKRVRASMPEFTDGCSSTSG